ncbi:KCNAG-like protein, partial [Mya arenaria]
MDSEQIHVNVGGQTYRISRDKIDNGPHSNLKYLVQNGCTVFDRPADMFSPILALYQTGELHIPVTSCPGAFLRELEFWDISPDILSQCCKNRIQSFLDEEETLRKFRKCQGDQYDNTPSRYSLDCIPFLRGIRATYVAVSLFMVLLSIFTVAYSTHPTFQRNMTNCERLQYMHLTNMTGQEQLQDILEQDCDSENIPEALQSTNHWNVDEDNFIEVLVLASPSRISTTTGTPAMPNGSFQTDPIVGDPIFIEYVKLPNMKVKIITFVVLELITVSFFTVDIVLRLCSCPCLLRYFTSVINIADAAALIATYIHMLCLFFFERKQYEKSWLDLLQFMQMLRAFRLFRITNNTRAGRVLTYTVYANIRDLLIVFLFLIAGMCTFASVFYIAERTDNIDSIPMAWYWAAITMTTVGYGDITPTTGIGRLVAVFCSISGVLLFALTVPIFANHFLSLYTHVGTVCASSEITAGRKRQAFLLCISENKCH